MQQLTSSQLTVVNGGTNLQQIQPFPPVQPLNPTDAKELLKAALATALIAGTYVLIDELIEGKLFS